MRYLVFLALLLLSALSAADIKDIPTAYNGRFRPMDAYARHWLQEFYNHTTIKKSDLKAFQTESPDALTLLWQMQFQEHQQWDEAPLFWIANAADKKTLGLDLKRSRFSYKEIKRAQKIPESVVPLIERYEQRDRFYPLPGKRGEGIWLPLSTLENPRNVTLFTDTYYAKLRIAYFNRDVGAIADALDEGYSALENTPYKKAAGKSLYYPSKRQLWLERIYMQYPFTLGVIILYSIATLSFLLLPRAAVPLTLFAFILHSLLLAARIYILQRPPVSNMFETVLYVPWVAVLVGLLMKRTYALVAATISAVALLLVLQLSQLESSMENVQAVLDSQYWLIIHVLMVVGSYGLFVMAGVLGHLYLVQWLRHKRETAGMEQLAHTLLQTLYVGVALLIPGTILGGVWAAQSWGRFWDWDPKESWAFISSCVYLIWIHAYTFRHIANFGLAIGSIAGLLAISFTWYGVNYILGTGLHSYGFGSGGEWIYALFVAFEAIFLITITLEKNTSNVLHSACIKENNSLGANETR